MPFTPAHTALVLPFLRQRWFSATGLIIGSIAPDFEYFLKMSVNGVHGHTLPGIFYFDLPVSVALAFLFHECVKQNFINNLPAFLQQWLAPLKALRFRDYMRTHWFVFLLSAAFGSLSHIFWDSFTHEDGLFVQLLPVYDDTVVPFEGVRYPLFYALQHISTFAGLFIVIFYILRMPSLETRVVSPAIGYWLLIALVVAAVLVFRFYWLPETFKLGNIVVSSITACCIALIVAGTIRFSPSKSINHS